MNNEDVYIVTITGPYYSSVTITSAEYVEQMTRQLRGHGRRVKVFRDREGYLQFLEKLEQERKENMRREWTTE